MTTLLDTNTAAVATPRTLRKSWPILIALTLATLVVTVDNSVLNVALPSIARELHAGTGELQWIGNAYSLLFGGLLLTGGNLADRLGRKRVLLFGLVAFGGASALVVFVHSGGQLIALRALIGAAAAFVMPGTSSCATASPAAWIWPAAALEPALPACGTGATAHSSAGRPTP